MEHTAPLRAAIYTRVSSDEQTKGYGLEYQLEDCKKAVARQGHRLVEIYSDPGISGTIENRPGLNQLREDARRHHFDVLYFWKSDRLARDELIQLTLYRELRALGVETCSVTEPAMNDLMRGIYAVFGAEDLRNIKAKMYSGRLRALRDGKWIGTAPYGYVKDKTFRLRPHKREAAYVRQLFDWFVHDRMSASGLTRRAYTKGIPTRWDTLKKQKPRNGATFWSNGGVVRLLKREYYATGIARFNYHAEIGTQTSSRGLMRGDVMEVSVPPLISMDLFQQAQEQLRHNQEYAPRRQWRQYLFAKKVRCGYCRRRLAACFRFRKSRPDGLRYYGFTGSSDPRCEHCSYYPESDLEGPIWSAMIRLFDDPESFLSAVDAYRSRASKRTDIAAEEASLDALAIKMHNAEKALLQHELDGFYSGAVLAAKRAEMATDRGQVAERRQQLERMVQSEVHRSATVSSVERLYRSLQTRIAAPTYSIKQQVIGILVDEILLYGDRAEVWLEIPAGGLRPPGGDAAHVGSGSSEKPRLRSRHVRRTPVMECVANDGGPIPVFFEVSLVRRRQKAAA